MTPLPCSPAPAPKVDDPPPPPPPKRPTLTYEPSIRWIGRWVPGYHDY